jgi:hypothetical protein
MSKSFYSCQNLGCPGNHASEYAVCITVADRSRADSFTGFLAPAYQLTEYQRNQLAIEFAVHREFGERCGAKTAFKDPLGDALRVLPILGTLNIDDPHDPKNKELSL